MVDEVDEEKIKIKIKMIKIKDKIKDRVDKKGLSFSRERGPFLNSERRFWPRRMPYKSGPSRHTRKNYCWAARRRFSRDFTSRFNPSGRWLPKWAKCSRINGTSASQPSMSTLSSSST
jgi:hypothetical protein